MLRFYPVMEIPPITQRHTSNGPSVLLVPWSPEPPVVSHRIVHQAGHSRPVQRGNRP
jgi:hypothetical protein